MGPVAISTRAGLFGGWLSLRLDPWQLAALVRHLGVLQVQGPERARDDVGDDGPRDPFVVGWDHIPGPTRVLVADGQSAYTHMYSSKWAAPARSAVENFQFFSGG